MREGSDSFPFLFRETAWPKHSTQARAVRRHHNRILRIQLDDVVLQRFSRHIPRRSHHRGYCPDPQRVILLARGHHLGRSSTTACTRHGCLNAATSLTTIRRKSGKPSAPCAFRNKHGCRFPLHHRAPLVVSGLSRRRRENAPLARPRRALTLRGLRVKPCKKARTTSTPHGSASLRDARRPTLIPFF